ncbi:MULTISPECIES: YraN family protein [unclassified Gordonia (in: high G+C Gram-positive bacteria)]|uniref:YraN family protein n=1 Tax=unclassified Gordonia (in: high G+C Gram-positive bacteria) TaxID=2657482 RepID=UPI001FFE635A|nr:MULTISPECIES: YraN family protein [unclassified Gordonia (in: high G+C Gram-positive bacteria)]UQE76610.1 YraN family protein [Gordonia sp. PP30]
MGEIAERRDRRGQVGRLGEDLAADHVAGLGWRILDRNWRTRYGELDLIAADGTTLVIVEVKTRASRTFTDPVAAVTADKLRRMRLLARQWLAAQPPGAPWWEIIRFDVVSIQLDLDRPGDRSLARLTHHTGLVD